MSGDGCDRRCRISTITYVHPLASEAGDIDGAGLALSGDGSTLEIGAIGDDDAAEAVLEHHR